MHGPRARTTATWRGTLRYIQVHRYESPLEAMLRESRGTAIEPYMGHAEAWFDRSVHRDGPDVAVARQLTSEDTTKFIDYSRSTMWLGKEHVLIDRWY
jgi:hypothetical protein